MKAMKEWFTPGEIASLRLPGLPVSQQGVWALAARDGWDVDPARRRKRAGRGGGNEYHYTLFPEPARAEVARRAAAEVARAARLPAVTSGAAVPATKPETPLAARSPKLVAASLDRQDAKLIILAAFDAFLAAHVGRMSKDKAVHKFVGHWCAGEIEADGWVRDTHPRLSPRSLHYWLAARAGGELGRLAGRYGNRAGSGRWDQELAAVHDQAIQLLCAQPHWSAVDVRDAMMARFREPDAEGCMVAVTGADGRRQLVPMPSLGEFQRMIREWKAAHVSLFRSFHDPDGWNNRDRLRLGSATDNITRLNELWMIDASPQDMLLTEGRHSLYLVVDVWSRRVLVSVTRTPRTEAMKLLLRRALVEWGAPERLKTDNGSDFTSREALRVFAALGIEHVAATPYAPWEKSFVERAIGTLQHGLYPRLPGYTGHNVAAAQRLRAKRGFSTRLGEDEREAFEVQLSAEQAQRLVDFWATETYGHRAHSGRGMDGTSPAAKAASWSGPVRRVADERALDLLLARVEGSRPVRGKGLRVNNAHYWAPELLPYLNTGERLEVRIDPADPATAYVWRQSPLEFVAVATCVEMLEPSERAALASAEGARQRAALRDQRAAVRAAGGETDRLSVAIDILGDTARQNRRGQVIALPTPAREIVHTSPELTEAGRAARLLAAPAARGSTPAEIAAVAKLEAEMAAPVPVPEQPEDRFTRALTLERRLTAGVEVGDADRRWLAGYQRSAEYRGYLMLHEDFGDQLLTA